MSELMDLDSVREGLASILMEEIVEPMYREFERIIAERDAAVAALEFYANEANYATPQGNASPPPAVALDGGRKAREARKQAQAST